MISVYYHQEFLHVKMLGIGLFVTLCHKLLLNEMCNYVINRYQLQLGSQMFIAFTRCKINESFEVNVRDRLCLGDFLANNGKLRKISNKDVPERLSKSTIFFVSLSVLQFPTSYFQIRLSEVAIS